MNFQLPDKYLPSGDSTPRQSLAVATLLGATGYAFILFYTVGIQLTVHSVIGQFTTWSTVLSSNLAIGLAALSTASLYFTLTPLDSSYIDIRRPDTTDIILMVWGFMISTSTLYAIGVIKNLIGIGSSQHTLIQTILSSGEYSFFIWLIAFGILIVAPGEELIYRNFVQKRLYRSFNQPTAIGITSSLFALIHFPAYAVAPLPQTISSLVTVFIISALFGWLYAHTENILVPMVAHGTYNGFIFLSLFLTHA